MILSYFLKRARLMRGLTHAKLAEMTGLSAASIGMYEAGKVKPFADKLPKLSKALKVSMEDLVDSYLEEENPDFAN